MLKNYIDAGGNKQQVGQGLAERVRGALQSASERLVTVFRVLRFVAQNRTALVRNRFIAVYAARTFGHDLQFFDVVSRLYYPRRVTWILLPGEHENPYLRQCFEHNLDFLILRVPARHAEFAATLAKMILSFYELRDVRWPRHFVIDPRHTVQTLSVDEGAYVFSPDRVAQDEDMMFLRSVPTSQYRHLILHDIGIRPALPAELAERCRQAIQARYPQFFDRPVAALVLRRKGHLGDGVNGRLRMGGDAENYVPAVRLLGEKGFHVVGTGDTLPDAFRGIDGFFDLADVGLDSQLLNIFLLTHCSLFIGQNSGPFPLVSSCGGQVVTIDAMPIAHAPLGRRDLVTYKRVFLNDAQRPASLAEIFRSHPHLVFQGIVRAPGVRIEPNTPDEILRTVAEAIDLYDNPQASDAAAEALADQLRAIAPPGCLLKYYDARPPRFLLEAMAPELAEPVDPPPSRMAAQ